MAKKKTDKTISGIYQWIDHIQDVVKFHTYHVTGEKYNKAVTCWIWAVIDNINKAKPVHPEKDGVLTTACMVGTFLFAWYFRTHLAKAYDPRRELKDRKAALRQLEKLREKMMRIMELQPTEEDKKIYDQEWEAPNKEP